MIFTTAELIEHYTQYSYILSTCLLNVGWVAMVTGFSFVLYSRLHLLGPSKTVLRLILSCIIVNAFLFHGPVVITTIYGDISFSRANLRAYEIASFTEIAFSVQETVIASLYIYFFLKYSADSRKEPETKAMLYLLIGAECMVLSTDIVLNVLLYMKIYLPRIIIQAFMSMLKLKIEFIVLNSLVEFAHTRSHRAVADVWLAPVQASEFSPDAGELSLSREDTVVPEFPSVGLTGDKIQLSSPRGNLVSQQEIV
jgi:hypothetical protein